MSGIVVLVLRTLLAASLYGFLGWAVYTLWKELRFQSRLVSASQVPPGSLTQVGEEGEKSRDFSGQEIMIGRDENSDFSISDETVSAQHARLSFHQSQWWVEDLFSTNGTFLNDVKVTTPTVIISGDELRCGRVNLQILIKPR
jgi:pSer/pThr/pTyr-binding forkhead associated (FHA) protein